MNTIYMILKDGKFTEENITLETMVLSGKMKGWYRNYGKIQNDN